MFLGSTFAGTDIAFQASPVPANDYNKIELKNMVLDELYATKDILIKFNWNIPSDWFYNTILHGLYQNNVHAGNVSYSESIVQKIKIKRRFKGEFDWKTILEKEIHENEDFAIEFYDYFNPSKFEIEYAYVAVIGGADSDAISTSVYSDFRDYFLCEKAKSYPLILDVKSEVSLNRKTAVLEPYGSKYPYVVANGMSKYYSGSLTATFIELVDCDFDVEHGWKYRNQIDEFLSNGKAKILKSPEGDIYMINIIDNLQRTTADNYQNVSHSINWVECGDPRSIGDLYDNDFIDTDIDRE